MGRVQLLEVGSLIAMRLYYFLYKVRINYRDKYEQPTAVKMGE